MDTTTLDSNTITLMVTIAGSWLTLVGLIFYQCSRLDSKIDALDTKVGTKIDALDTKFDKKFDALDTKFDKKFDALGSDVTDVRERLARIEGHLMGPGSVTPGQSPAPADEIDDDHRQAG